VLRSVLGPQHGWLLPLTFEQPGGRRQPSLGDVSSQANLSAARL
jgi:hypothetical protein